MTPEPDESKRFEQLADRKPPSIVVEFYDFLRENQKWWLVPILLMIGLFSLLVVLAGTGWAPWIYTMW